MNTEDLIRAIGNLDEELVKNTVAYQAPRRSEICFWYCAFSACLIMFTALAIFQLSRLTAVWRDAYTAENFQTDIVDLSDAFDADTSTLSRNDNGPTRVLMVRGSLLLLTGIFAAGSLSFILHRIKAIKKQ